jgi:hypothetical protein
MKKLTAFFVLSIIFLVGSCYLPRIEKKKGPYGGHPRMEFKDVILRFGTHKDKVYKKIKKWEKKYKRYNASVNELEKYKGYQIISAMFDRENSDGMLRPHYHYFYFKGGPFLDAYQYVTSDAEYYSLLRKSYEFALETDPYTTKIKILMGRGNNAVTNPFFNITNLYGYRDEYYKYEIYFGAEHRAYEYTVYSITIRRK